jgi:hypothetical protein
MEHPMNRARRALITLAILGAAALAPAAVTTLTASPQDNTAWADDAPGNTAWGTTGTTTPGNTAWGTDPTDTTGATTQNTAW